MKKMFLFLTVIGILTAPTMLTEAAEVTPQTVTAARTVENQDRTEARLLKEAKRVAREIFKAQKNAKKAERTETASEIDSLREHLKDADRTAKKEIREKIAALRENKKFDTVEEFLDNLVLYYGDNEVMSQGNVVSVADTRKNLDATVVYDSKTRTLTLTTDNTTVTVTLDAEGAYVDGEALYTRGKESTEVE